VNRPRVSSEGRAGIGLAILSAVLFGASTPFAKTLVSEVHPFLLAGLLYLGSGAGLAALLPLRRLAGARRREAPLRLGGLPWLVGAIVTGGVAGPALLMFGLRETTASAASLLLNLEGLATMGVAWLVFRENVDRRVFVGAMAILAGAIALSWPGGGTTFGWGALAIAGACLAWGVDNNLTRKLSAADPVQIAMIKGVAAGAVNSALALLAGARLPDAGAVMGAAGVGALGYGLSLALFIRALRDLGTARTGAYFSTAPFVGAPCCRSHGSTSRSPDSCSWRRR
jgi:drug/metabolite transporter (DMT)-like permease